MMVLKNPVYLMSICVLIFSSMAIHQALHAPSISAEFFGSGRAPMAVAIFLILLTLIMLIQEFLVNDISSDRETRIKGASTAVKGTVLALALISYVAMLEITNIPFWALTFGFLVTGGRIIAWRLREWLVLSLVTSALLAIFIEFTFSRFLLISLP